MPRRNVLLELLNEMFGDHSFKEIMEEYNSQSDELESETFEVTKAGVKTIITYRFNKQGYPVSSYHESGPVQDSRGQLESLTANLKKSLENEDYHQAAEIQKKIKLLHKEKPS